MDPSPPRKQRDLFPGLATPDHPDQDDDQYDHDDASPRGATTVDASNTTVGGVTSPLHGTVPAPPMDGRKRPRNSMGVNNSMKAKAAADFRGAIQDLYSESSEKIALAINIVLIRSYDDSNPVNLEEIPELLPALSYVLDLINPIGSLVYTGKSNLSPEQLIYTNYHESPWPTRIKTERDDFFVIASRSLQDNKLMEYVCTILQNLSFEQSNEMIIVYNASVLRHLISLLYVDGSTGKHGEMYKIIELSYGILSRCARFLDATGARRAEPDLFLVDAIDGKIMNTMGVATVPLLSSNDNNPQHAYIKGDYRLLFGEKNSNRFKEFYGEETTVLVVELIRGLFPLLLHRMHSMNRGTVLFSLELLSRLALSPENEKIFRAAPDSMYKKLVELLYVSTSGTDPFELGSKIHPATDLLNQGNGAITDIIGFNGIENKKLPACTVPITEMIDLEMRDYALDTLYNLCLLSQEFMCRRMVKIPNCIFYLQKIIETPAPATVKSEMNIPQKASSILNFMIADETLHGRLKCLEKDFNVGAANDSVMADFVSGPTLKLFFDNYDPPEDTPAYPITGISTFQGVGGDHIPRRGGNGSNQYVRRVTVSSNNDGDKDVSVLQPRLTLKLSMGNKRDRAPLDN